MKPEAPSRPLVLKVGSVADGEYYAAGAPIPFDAETIPDSLRPYLDEDAEPDEPQGPPSLNFEQGRIQRQRRGRDHFASRPAPSRSASRRGRSAGMGRGGSGGGR